MQTKISNNRWHNWLREAHDGESIVYATGQDKEAASGLIQEILLAQQYGDVVLTDRKNAEGIYEFVAIRYKPRYHKCTISTNYEEDYVTW